MAFSTYWETQEGGGGGDVYVDVCVDVCLYLHSPNG